MADDQPDLACSNCGKLRSEHAKATTPHGTIVFICPKAVFRAMGEKPEQKATT